jgi:hypothetical protein
MMTTIFFVATLQDFAQVVGGEKIKKRVARLAKNLEEPRTINKKAVVIFRFLAINNKQQWLVEEKEEKD